MPDNASGTESFLEFKYERIWGEHLLHNFSRVPKVYERTAES